MHYTSTRGGIAPVSFQEAVMMGLATDGGLLLPVTIPKVDGITLNSWQDLSFQELAHAIMTLFIDDIPSEDLKTIINRSYSTFTHPEITPVVEVNGFHILELFHGPTFAFKDVALQFLGNIFEYILDKTSGKMNILGATSGDTGSAAIYGVRGKQRINIFIIHPYKKISPIQELQMTTVKDENVFNMAIRGTFDDGQSIVKEIFNNISFKEKFHLGAVNSINWARILAQIVYYVYAWLRMSNKGCTAVDFSVPTGNFGDIFAGYIAKHMLPHGCIRNLILATNENDLLTRFVTKGDYSKGSVVSTSSPSMDIQISSNFERYLYYLHREDPEKTRQHMEIFAKNGALNFSEMLDQIQLDFVAKSVSEKETSKTIQEFFRATGYILDPHTAVGVNAAHSEERELDDKTAVVCLATAHPAKFGEAVKNATGRQPAMPPPLRDLKEKDARCEIMDASVEMVQNFIAKNAL